METIASGKWVAYAGVAALLAAGVGRPAAGAADAHVPLLRDTGFRQGVTVYDPAPGRHVARGALRADPNTPPPRWGLAQWHSRFTLAAARAEPTAAGVRFADGSKSVAFTRGGLVLAIDSGREYGGRPRRKGQPWPHLLVEQKIADCPPLTRLDGLRFRIECRLLRAKAHEPGRHDRRLHAAQFQAFVTVQDRRRGSPGRGDYLWFGVPIYDSRWRIPRGHAAQDFAGTGKFIHTPAGSAFTEQSAHDGNWVRIDADVLPMIRRALRTARERGYLKRSPDDAAFQLGSFNLGWEMPGAFDAAMAVRGLALVAGVRGPATRAAIPPRRGGR